jgi:hypothetical protein
VADSAVLEERRHVPPRAHMRARAVRLAIGIAVWTFLIGNAAGENVRNAHVPTRFIHAERFAL